ncbi:MAG: glutathione peroxidase, partial [Bdellovibrionota bacterium]
MLLKNALGSFIAILFLSSNFALSADSSAAKGFFALNATDIAGKKVEMSKYKGQTLLVVNTASKCGYTPQLKDLEEIYQKYKSKGFVVLAFPSNDFKQEPNEGAACQSVSEKEYGTTFPFFERIKVTGDDKHPIYKYLTDQKPGAIFKEVAWNFEKFLVNKEGQVIERWTSKAKPMSQ